MKKTLLFFSCMSAICLGQAQTTVTYDYNGSEQYFVVPSTVTSIKVDLQGASGGNISNLSQSPNAANGGKGGRVQATITVIPNDTLWVYVGDQGTDDGLTLTCFSALGGYNGGGTGFGGYNSYNYNSGGGGGASDIRQGGKSLAKRIFVAGGGGGAGCSGCTGGGALGGDGGNLTGADGQSISCFASCNYGSGGTLFGGGAAGQWACTTGNAMPGTLGMGGNADSSGQAVTCGSGGGGGAGYYGGGGGSAGPGGGGNSYASSSATGVVHTQGFKTGKGKVLITYTPTTTGIISNNNGTSIKIYPNPSNGQFHLVESLEAGVSKIVVVNLLGETIYQSPVTSSDYLIDLGGQSAGIYICRMLNVSGQVVYTHKLVIQ